jgi:hypothetical protein
MATRGACLPNHSYRARISLNNDFGARAHTVEDCGEIVCRLCVRDGDYIPSHGMSIYRSYCQLSISPLKLKNRSAFCAGEFDLRSTSVVAFYEWLHRQLILTIGVNFISACADLFVGF